MNPTAKKWAYRLRDRARRGVAAVEFALAMPVLVTLLLGAADGSYYLLSCERADRIAYSITDIVTQYETVSIANLKDIVQAASQLMEPFPFANNGVVIITSVYKAAGSVPKVMWQYTGGGSLSKTSQVGTYGGAATLPNGLTLNDNDNVVVTEVYYNFSPLFAKIGLFKAVTVYRVALYKPRLSPLVTPPT